MLLVVPVEEGPGLWKPLGHRGVGMLGSQIPPLLLPLASQLPEAHFTLTWLHKPVLPAASFRQQQNLLLLPHSISGLFSKYTVGPLNLQVPYLWVQPTAD